VSHTDNTKYIPVFSKLVKKKYLDMRDSVRSGVVLLTVGKEPNDTRFESFLGVPAIFLALADCNIHTEIIITGN
jgi:hypothetical protein